MGKVSVRLWRMGAAVVVLLAGAVICDAAPGAARPFALCDVPAAGGRVLLRLTDRATGRPVWERRVLAAGPIAWSADGRALAASISDASAGPVSPFRLLYWRAGHAMRLVPYPALFADFDEVADLSWSPDGRRFAFLGGSTAFDSGGPIIGTLCCVDAATGHFFFGPGNVGRYRWVNGDRLRYVPTYVVPGPRRPHGSNGVYAVKPPRVWSGTVTDPEWEDPAWLRGKVRLHGRRWPW